HRVVAHADQAHHLNMRRYRRGTGKLRVGVHSAHGVGHAVGSRAGSHVVRVQGAAGAAAGSNREVLHAVLDAPFLVGASYWMLEAGRVGRVAGDGNVNLLQLHNGNAFLNVVAAVAFYLGFVAVRESNLADDMQLTAEVVVLGLHIGEAVDSGNDVRCILAQTVEDDAQRRFSCLVGGSG